MPRSQRTTRCNAIKFGETSNGLCKTLLSAKGPVRMHPGC